MENQIYYILNDMSEVLSVSQMKKLREVLIKRLEVDEENKETIENETYLELFLTAKRIEGCSERTLNYYKVTIENMLKEVKTPVRRMTTEILREYLSNYQNKNNCSKVTVDNVRRNLSGKLLVWI